MRSLRLLQHFLVFHAASGWNPLASLSGARSRAALEHRCADADSDATSLLQLEADLEADRRRSEADRRHADAAPSALHADASDVAQSGGAAQSSGSCPATCSGRTCDHWPDVACERLEQSYGCDCGGCICRVGSHARVAQAAAAGAAGAASGLRGSTPPAEPQGLPGWSADMLQAADLIQGCGGSYDSLASRKAQSLDTSRLMGKWREVASRNIPFLADSCKCSTWDLRATEDQGAYTVDFECQTEAWWSFLSPRVSIPSTGVAEWAGPPGKLIQVLFGKLQMPYWVLDYWGDYEQALVYRCAQVGPFKQEYIHFLSRDAAVPDSIRLEMAQYAHGVGLNLSLVRPVPMDGCSAPAPAVHGDLPDASRAGRLPVRTDTVVLTNCTGDDGSPINCPDGDLVNSTAADNYSSDDVSSTPTSPASKACQDSAGDAVDAEGFGCEAYSGLSPNCGGDDDADFTAKVMCCACQGLCQDSAGNAKDAEGVGCEAYVGLPSNCGADDDADFTASAMCCACEGLCEDSAGDAKDAEGFGCEAYSGLSPNCGGDDDADFTAKDMCCACKGLLGKHTTTSQGGLVGKHKNTSQAPSSGLWISQPPKRGSETCLDTAGVAVDAEGFGCEGYTSMQEYCRGDDDDADFTASVMCCACKGEGEATPPGLEPPPRSGVSKQGLAVELAAEISIAGCANLGGGKWFSDPHGTLFQVKQVNCMITFALNTNKGVHFDKGGIVRGTKVFVEPPFPSGRVVDGNIRFDNGAWWERKW